MDLGLDGTKVMILGASRGIGRMTAEIFAEEGADLAICARNLEGLEVAKTDLLAVGEGSVFSSVADLSDASILGLSSRNSANVRSEVRHSALASVPSPAGVKGLVHFCARSVTRMSVVVARSFCAWRQTSS